MPSRVCRRVKTCQGLLSKTINKGSEMSRECSKLLSCPFFQKYKNLDKAEVVRLRSLFCKGPYMDQCVRKLYRELHGAEPDDRMNPEGKSMEDSETASPREPEAGPPAVDSD